MRSRVRRVHCGRHRGKSHLRRNQPRRRHHAGRHIGARDVGHDRDGNRGLHLYGLAIVGSGSVNFHIFILAAHFLILIHVGDSTHIHHRSLTLEFIPVPEVLSGLLMSISRQLSVIQVLRGKEGSIIWQFGIKGAKRLCVVCTPMPHPGWG